MRNLQITSSITNRESRSVETYFTEIGRVELISAEEEVILAGKIKQGDQAALERLIKANLRFVVSVAKKYQHQGLPLNDLINEGNLGLIKAAKRFDETRGFKFISFAVWWIRQSIMAAITENARIVQLPMNKINEITKVNRAMAAVEQQTLREPTPSQVADYLDMPVKKVSDALYYAPWASSLDLPIGEDEYTLLDKLPSNYAPADQWAEAASFDFELNGLLASLSETERQVIEMTYGLSGGLAMSPAAISLKIGVSAEWVRQVRNKALNKLRNNAPRREF